MGMPTRGILLALPGLNGPVFSFDEADARTATYTVVPSAVAATPCGEWKRAAWKAPSWKPRGEADERARAACMPVVVAAAAQSSDSQARTRRIHVQCACSTTLPTCW
jgi:hypothetical protein